MSNEALIESFEDFVEAVSFWGDEGFRQTGDSVWPLCATLGISYVVNTSDVPVSRAAWEAAKQNLRDYEHILDVAIDTLMEHGFLALDDDLKLSFAIPEYFDGEEDG